MIFDEGYILNLAIRISDFDTINKYSRNAKKYFKSEKDLHELLYRYSIDKKIFSIFNLNKPDLNKNPKIFNKSIVSMINNPSNNYEAIVEFLKINKRNNLNFFIDDNKSVLTSLIYLNDSGLKKNKLFNIFLRKKYVGSTSSVIINAPPKDRMKNLLENIDPKNLNSSNLSDIEEAISNIELDLNFKNSKGMKNSKIISEDDPTLLENLFLEKLENLTVKKNIDNSYLFNENSLYFRALENKDLQSLKDYNDNYKIYRDKNELIKSYLKKFISEPIESEKISFNDIEFKAFLLNIKLKSMFEIKCLSLNNNNFEEFLNKKHLQVLDNFLFENLLLEKI